MENRVFFGNRVVIPATGGAIGVPHGPCELMWVAWGSSPQAATKSPGRPGEMTLEAGFGNLHRGPTPVICDVKGEGPCQTHRMHRTMCP